MPGMRLRYASGGMFMIARQGLRAWAMRLMSSRTPCAPYCASCMPSTTRSKAPGSTSPGVAAASTPGSAFEATSSGASRPLSGKRTRVPSRLMSPAVAAVQTSVTRWPAMRSLVAKSDPYEAPRTRMRRGVVMSSLYRWKCVKFTAEISQCQFHRKSPHGDARTDHGMSLNTRRIHNRKSHFLGTKLRSLRKASGLTLDELSARCIQLDPQSAPSVSYLSMIESGKRVPSDELLGLLSKVFQREPRWFLDGNPQGDTPTLAPPGAGPAAVPLEPAFLFSKELLQAAIPELLAQTGTTGRQFAHLLIRSHQEMSRNDFPDLERAAESVGERRFPLSAEDLMRLCSHHGLKLCWFDRKPVLARDNDRELRSMVRSFFEPPRSVYLNRQLQLE